MRGESARLYHAVPNDLVGTTLQPLSALRSLAPEVHKRAIAKYRDDPRRATIPERRIAKLDCAGADVINLSPVDPRLIHRAWAELGVDLGSADWYAIPIDQLRSMAAVITRPDRIHQVGAGIEDDAVAWLNPNNYRELEELPEQTLAWYRQLAAAGRRGGWFVGIPHILVKGAIELTDVPIIDWSDGDRRCTGPHPLTGR